MTDTTNTSTTQAAAWVVRDADGKNAMIGVGDGSGELFVRGSHEAVKRVQSIILGAERLRELLEHEQQERQAVLDRLADAVFARAASQAQAERYMAERNAALAALAQAREASGALVDEIDDLMNESDGVAGLHLNGDVADWSELVPGGRFERLSSLDDVRALTANIIEAQRAVVQQLASRPACDWPGKCRHQRQATAAAPERAEPVQGPVWLTDERIAQIAAQTWGSAGIAPQSAAAFARAIEAWMLGASSPWSAAPERAADLGENIIEAQRAQIRTLTAERDAALAQAREVLREVEWVSDEIPYATLPDYHRCPSCWAERREGHASDCKLNAALAAKGE